MVLGTVRAIDLESDPLSYFILTNNNGLFEIGASNGEISLADGQSLDFETIKQYPLILAVSDGMFSNTAAVTIWVTNVNDNVPVFSPNAYTWAVAEDISDTNTIGLVSAGDPDGDLNPLSYFILTNDNGLFEIGANGELSLAAGTNLDFETTDQHLITLSVSDGTFSNTALVTIEVTNVNDHAPPSFPPLTTRAWAVTEDISDTNTIGRVSASDLDGDLNPLTYSLLTNDNGLFEIGSSNGDLSLVAGTNLDFETTNQHLITLSVSDGTFSNTSLVTIEVTDANDNAPSFDLPSYAFTQGEDIKDDDVLGTVSATDVESDALTFFILINDNGLFEIGISNGDLSLVAGTNLDFETTNQHLITLSVSDGILSETVPVTIWVTNVNDNAPYFSMLSNSSAAEDISDTDTIALVSARDPDGDLNPLTFSIFSNDNGLFEIETNSGAISLANGRELDFETTNQHLHNPLGKRWPVIRYSHGDYPSN